MATHLSVPIARGLIAMLGSVLALGLMLSTPARAIVEGTDCEAEPTDQPIEYGDLIHCSIDVIADEDQFRFQGSNGETVRVQSSRLSGPGLSCFQVFAPDGTPTFPGVPCGGSRDILLEQSGTHTIVMTEAGNDQRVNKYTLALERISPPSPAALPIDYDEVKSDQINKKGDVDIWFFSGATDDTVRVAVAKLSGTGLSCFQVFAPDGTPTFPGVPCGGSRDILLDQTGPHTIVITDAGNDQTVKYQLTLVCLAGSVCPGPDPLPPDVSGCISFRGAPLVNRRVRLTQRDEDFQEDRTDIRGCYEFESVIAAGKTFQVRIFGPVVPEIFE